MLYINLHFIIVTGDHLYRVTGMIMHTGSAMDSGHYTGLNQSGEVFVYSDDAKDPVKVLKEHVTSFKNVYVVMYTKCKSKTNVPSAITTTTATTTISNPRALTYV